MPADAILLGQIETRLGTFGALMTPRGVARLTFPTESLALARTWADRHFPECRLVDSEALAPALVAVLSELRSEVNRFLAGDLQCFTTPVDLRGTPFQQDVWQALAGIGYARTSTYSDIAIQIGRPKAIRAVGAACGANPVPLLVPCHRVIGRDGRLVGYAGTVALKQELLDLERKRDSRDADTE